MNVLVTGSSGKIGHYAVRELKAAGHTVLGIDIVLGENTGLRVDLTASGEIIQTYCPDTEVRGGLKGFESPLSCKRATREFGYEPQYV